MNKNIKLAVAGAVLALSASAANAGIIIPAGEWTLDINGNVNAFANYTHADRVTGPDTSVVGGWAATPLATGPSRDKAIGINTGLLPSWLGFTGTTRQNDLDVSFTISMQPNVSDNGVTGDNTFGAAGGFGPLWRQAFLTFGDKSWGSVKLGKDIGIFASDAILNDMTLLGVGAGGAGNAYANVASGGATTLGGIGTGYIYAAWKGQVAYSTPNFNGFQATVGITNPNQIGTDGLFGSQNRQDRYGLEAKASYSFTQDNFSGKVWVSGASYDVTRANDAETTVSVGDIGATVKAGDFGLTGYYYGGKGAGKTFLGFQGVDANGNRRDSDGGYVQLTYVTPIKTKLGLAYGISSLDRTSQEGSTNLVKDDERYTVGLYHPLTKHLNLVAEYNNVQSEAHNGTKAESQTYSAGAILFF
jgi:predicted porin